MTTRAATIAALRARIQAIDGSAAYSTDGSAGAPLSLGVAAIDAVLPWGGLPRGCLHELIGGDGSAAVAGFAALLLAGFAGAAGSVIWCRQHPGISATHLYPPGLTAFGLDPARLVVVHARNETDVLWAMENALRCRALAAVLGESRTVAPVAWRRLQLAAANSGVPAVLLRRGGAAHGGGTATGAVSRWRVNAAPQEHRPSSAARTRWRLELLRCRSGVPAAWLVEWCDETHRLALAAEPRHRPAAGTAAASVRRRAV
jgi:protein ImuA